MLVLLFSKSLSAVIMRTSAQSGDYILGMQQPHKQLISFYPNRALYLLAIRPGLNIVNKGSFLSLSSFSTYPFVLGYSKQDPALAPIDDTKM